MKQALGGGQLEMGEFSSSRMETKYTEFSDELVFQMTNVPLATHAAINETRRLEVMGEFVLVQAILREAIRTYQKYAVKKGTRASRLFREVDEWFASEDRQWFFSFVNVCDVLGLEPTYIRTGLKLWRENRLRANALSANVEGRQRIAARDRPRPSVSELRG